MTKSARNKKQPKTKPVSTPNANPPIDAELSIEERAIALLQEPDFFRELRESVERGGLVGEVQNALAIFVVAVSALLQRPLNCFVKAVSSAGKNFLVSKVLRLLPPSAIIPITSASETAFNYVGTEFKNKVIYIPEKNDAAGADRVRNFITEGELRRIVTIRQGAEFIKKEFVAEGPIAAISTTTRNSLEIDDETRHISLWIDESKEQTRRILARQAEPLIDLSPEELEVWRKAHDLIAKRAAVPVELPNWRKQIIDKVYAGNISVRRYFPAFLEAFRTIALIRSFREHPQDYEPDEKIVATFADYAVATYIFDGLFTETLNRGDDESAKTLAAIQKMVEDQDGAIDAAQFAKLSGISYDKAAAKLRAALEAGTIVLANKPGKNNSKVYRPNGLTRFVPAPEDVASEIGLKKPVTVFHPVTGKKLTFGGK